MRNYIILNDQNSNDISGLLIQSLAPISKPLMRTEIEEIDGRDGDITTKLGYSAYDKQITIGLFGNYDVDQVIAFFNSEGTAIFSNEPDKYYNYQIVDQIDFERLVRYKTATVTMHCQPFKYSTTEGADILSSSDNFATLNQSLNTDSSFYTYSSNVQADITATRQSGTGGKFFAVFTVPVVQGVNYHFSGNVSRNVSMYGYTDQLRGTSAGIAGKGFSGNFVYTATFTGTMVLGFYSNATTEIFIRNFAISNEAGTTISDEGTNLVLEGTGEAPFSQFDLKGNTEQTGDPTPDAPIPVKVVTGENEVKICTKNIFDGETINAWLRPNGTVVNSNGDRTSANYIAVLPNTAYTLHGTQSTYLKFTQFDSSKTAVSQQTTTSATSLTVTTGVTTAFIRIGWGNAANASDVMLELGSQASDYEPYRDQSYEVNLGKNLFDKDNANIFNGYLGSSGIVEAANARAVYIPVVAGQTYTFSRANSTSQVNDPYYAFIANEPAGGGQYIEGRHAVGRNDLTFTGTAPAGSKYLIFYFAWNPSAEAQATILSTYQLEKGSTATSYAPYFEPIELCKIGTYQDYIYKSGDKWYKHKEVGKVILNGSETWTTQTNTPGYKMYRLTLSGVASNTASAVANLRTDSFSPASSDEVYTSTSGYKVSQLTTAGYVRFFTGDQTDKLAEFKTWLGNNTPALYYALATPVDEEITNAALIEQLNDIADHAHAYKERTHISSTYAEGNVPYIIAAAVTGDADGTVTNSGNIYSKPKLTIFGTGDIGVYLNGVQMFQIALGTSGYITIDTALMEAYQDNLQTLMNRQVTGDYSNFVLNPGDNQISFTGSVSMCVVENYSRWL